MNAPGLEATWKIGWALSSWIPVQIRGEYLGSVDDRRDLARKNTDSADVRRKSDARLRLVPPRHSGRNFSRGRFMEHEEGSV